jgi:CNT family concentrative nucleoside transporter
MAKYHGVVGLVAILIAAYLFSSNRKAIQARVLIWGVVLQFAFAFIVLKTGFGKVFYQISLFVNSLLAYAGEGSRFVFGDKLGLPSDQFGVIFAFQILPIIIFICSLFAILYYLGVMQIFVKGMAVFMQQFMGTSGAESTCVAASIVMGQTEAPVTIRPFLATLTESELFTVMVSGMAHVSGAVMAAYVAIAHVSITHLLTAVIMTAPATIMLAKMFVPENLLRGAP